MSDQDSTTFNFTYSDLCMRLGGQVLLVIILVILFYFGADTTIMDSEKQQQQLNKIPEMIQSLKNKGAFKNNS